MQNPTYNPKVTWAVQKQIGKIQIGKLWLWQNSQIPKKGSNLHKKGKQKNTDTELDSHQKKNQNKKKFDIIMSIFFYQSKKFFDGIVGFFV